MIIDSHTHISITNKGGSFEKSKQKLLVEMERNKISKTIIIPDNLHDTQCADFEMVAKLIKDEKKLLMVTTARINEINKKNLGKIKKLFSQKKSLGL